MQFIFNVILLSLVLLVLYGPFHLTVVFLKRVVQRYDCRISKAVMWVSSLSFLILMIFTVPNFVRAKASGQFTACQSNCKNIGTALDVYSTDHNGKYPESLGELTPHYINEIPKCPTQNDILSIAGHRIYPLQKPKDTYPPLYQVYNDPTGKHCRFTFCCAGENHRIIIQGNYPRYNSEEGLFYDQ